MDFPVRIFGSFECVSSLFCLKLLLPYSYILQMLFYQRRPSEALLYCRMVSSAQKKSIG
jgi:hypothetical protein